MEKFAIVWRDADPEVIVLKPLVDALKKAVADYSALKSTERQQIDAKVVNGKMTKEDITNYEKQYMASFKSFDQLRAELKKTAAANKAVLLFSAEKDDSIAIFVERDWRADETKPPPKKNAWGTGAPIEPPKPQVVLGTAYGKTQRFEVQKLGNVVCGHDSLLVHKTSRVQYVLDSKGRPVRRFVKRAINEYDCNAIAKKWDLRSSVNPKSDEFTKVKTQKKRTRSRSQECR